MSEVTRYLIQKTPIGTIMKPNPEGNWIAAEDHDRVTAERDALQLLLNVADQRSDEHLQLLNFAAHYLEESSFNSVGDVIEHTQEMRDEFRKKIEATLSAPAEACQFPQSCTTRCDCDIPDFSPGNGNKARRRAAAIEALRPENQRITPCNPDASKPCSHKYHLGECTKCGAISPTE